MASMTVWFIAIKHHWIPKPRNWFSLAEDQVTDTCLNRLIFPSHSCHFKASQKRVCAAHARHAGEHNSDPNMCNKTLTMSALHKLTLSLPTRYCMRSISWATASEFFSFSSSATCRCSHSHAPSNSRKNRLLGVSKEPQTETNTEALTAHNTLIYTVAALRNLVKKLPHNQK